jgi:hypothetical protein
MGIPTYLILGTSHDIQWEGGAPGDPIRGLIDGLRNVIRHLVSKHRVALIAEEAPVNVQTVAHQVASEKGAAYLQIDDPRDRSGAGDAERPEIPPGYDECRCCEADDRRENSWLDRIEAADSSPVLVVCGWAHTCYLAKKVVARDCKVAETLFCPLQLERWKIAECP